MHDPEHPMTNTPNKDTDLPLSPCGNNGNKSGASSDVVAQIARLFREMVEALPEPPYELVDASAVAEWIKLAAPGVGRRRQRERLLREAERVLWSDWASLLAAERKRTQLVRAAAYLEAREVGTYWRDRDSHRAATRPVHVFVDRVAWAAAKQEATRRNVSVGVVVGEVVEREVRRPRARIATGDSADRIRIFTRVAVTAGSWAAARNLASAAGNTIECFVGYLVEEAFSNETS